MEMYVYNKVCLVLLVIEFSMTDLYCGYVAGPGCCRARSDE